MRSSVGWTARSTSGSIRFDPPITGTRQPLTSGVIGPRGPDPTITDSDSDSAQPRETPAEASARLLREQVAKARAALAAKAAANPYRPPADVSVETIQAEATAANARAFSPVVDPRPIEAGLPPEVAAAIGLPFVNPPVHRKQIRPIPGDVDKEGFLARVRSLPPVPKLSNKTMTAVARAIAWAIGLEVRGVAIISYTGLATAAQCCRTQVWRAIKVFKARGILDIFNVLVRPGNELLREPNAYSLRGFTKAIPATVDAVKDAVTHAFDRVSEQVRRFARVWDMRANRGARGSVPKPRIHPPPA